MTILHISDTHNLHHRLTELPDADVIIHSGDFTMNGSEQEALDFMNWFCDLDYPHKIFISGNHDNCLYGADISGLDNNVHYLCNSAVVIDGVKFYGVPMFMGDCVTNRQTSYYDNIPEDTDVLITHTPPFGILDIDDNVNYGSEELLARIMTVKPHLHLFGHIHSQHGMKILNNITFSNGAIMDAGYSLHTDDISVILLGDTRVQIFPVVQPGIKILHNASENSGGLAGLPSGYTKLDELTGGWQNSDFVIIGGRPSMGKTSFAMSLARNMAVAYNVPIAFFIMEMNKDDLANRFLKENRLTKAPIYVDDTPGLSVFELRAKARRLVREKGVKIIMIDYLQLMNASGMKFGSRQEEVSIISRSLKELAKELDIPILVLSQVGREAYWREGMEGKRPRLSDFCESPAMVQDADMVLFVHRPEYYRIYDDGNGNDLRGKAEIIIAKHRMGVTGIVTLKFNQYSRFYYLDNDTYKCDMPF